MIQASTLETAFPQVNPGITALGARVVVQLRTVVAKTASGLWLAEDTKEFNKANTQLGKVVQMGPIAYHDRKSGIIWPEGTWAQVGDFVRVPKWGGDRFTRKIPGSDDSAIFCIFMDHEIIAKIDPDAFQELDEVM